MRRWTFYLMRVSPNETWRSVAPHLLTADSDLLTAARNLLDQKSGGVHLQAVGSGRLRSRHA